MSYRFCRSSDYFLNDNTRIGQFIIDGNCTGQLSYSINRYQARAATTHAAAQPETGNSQVIRNQAHQGVIAVFGGLHLYFFVFVDQRKKD